MADGDVIEAYPGDAPYPSSLILGFAETRPVHAVVARDQRRVSALSLRYTSRTHRYGPKISGAGGEHEMRYLQAW